MHYVMSTILILLLSCSAMADSGQDHLDIAAKAYADNGHENAKKNLTDGLSKPNALKNESESGDLLVFFFFLDPYGKKTLDQEFSVWERNKPKGVHVEYIPVVSKGWSGSEYYAIAYYLTKLLNLSNDPRRFLEKHHDKLLAAKKIDEIRELFVSFGAKPSDIDRVVQGPALAEQFNRAANLTTLSDQQTVPFIIADDKYFEKMDTHKALGIPKITVLKKSTINRDAPHEREKQRPITEEEPKNRKNAEAAAVQKLITDAYNNKTNRTPIELLRVHDQLVRQAKTIDELYPMYSTAKVNYMKQRLKGQGETISGLLTQIKLATESRSRDVYSTRHEPSVISVDSVTREIHFDPCSMEDPDCRGSGKVRFVKEKDEWKIDADIFTLSITSTRKRLQIDR